MAPAITSVVMKDFIEDKNLPSVEFGNADKHFGRLCILPLAKQCPRKLEHEL